MGIDSHRSSYIESRYISGFKNQQSRYNLDFRRQQSRYISGLVFLKSNIPVSSEVFFRVPGVVSDSWCIPSPNVVVESWNTTRSELSSIFRSESWSIIRCQFRQSRYIYLDSRPIQIYIWIQISALRSRYISGFENLWHGPWPAWERNKRFANKKVFCDISENCSLKLRAETCAIHFPQISTPPGPFRRSFPIALTTEANERRINTVLYSYRFN